MPTLFLSKWNKHRNYTQDFSIKHLLGLFRLGWILDINWETRLTRCRLFGVRFPWLQIKPQDFIVFRIDRSKYEGHMVVTCAEIVFLVLCRHFVGATWPCFCLVFPIISMKMRRLGQRKASFFTRVCVRVAVIQHKSERPVQIWEEKNVSFFFTRKWAQQRQRCVLMLALAIPANRCPSFTSEHVRPNHVSSAFCRGFFFSFF